MHLASDRLHYDKIKPANKLDVISWYANTEVMQLVTGNPLSEQEAEAKFETILNINKSDKEGYFAVSLKSSEEFIGIAKYTLLADGIVEVGYGMMPPFWGVGYGSEILKALMELAAKDPTIKSLRGIVNKENHASIRILEKHGFVFEKSSADLKTQYFIKKNYSAAAEGIC